MSLNIKKKLIQKIIKLLTPTENQSKIEYNPIQSIRFLLNTYINSCQTISKPQPPISLSFFYFIFITRKNREKNQNNNQIYYATQLLND